MYFDLHIDTNTNMKQDVLFYYKNRNIKTINNLPKPYTQEKKWT